MHRLARALAGGPAAARAWKLLLALLVAGVSYLALSPQPPPGADLGWDKLNHLLAFMSLALCAWLGDPAARISRAWLLVGLVAFGGLIEVLQLFVPGRSADWGDLLADSIGIAFGALIAAAVLQAASTRTAPSR